MRYISLFSGIAGLDRAMDAVGGECVVQVEREPYCLDVLRLRYPDVPKVDNVYGFAGHKVDLVVGGPPCQPVSHAGRRKGTEDERWLWGEALRVVGEARPERVFFENPMGLRTLGLSTVLDGLTELGYGGAWEVVAAADVGAPHLRKRIFIMGIRGRSGWDGPTRPPGNRGVLWPTPSLPGGGRTIPENAEWRGATTAYSDGKKLQVGLDSAVRKWPERGPVAWPSPNASGERPNEGNVRLLRARVLAGDMTEQEAAGMLNGKSPFEAQGKVPAWPTPTARDHFPPHTPEYIASKRALGHGMANLSDAVTTDPRYGNMPTPTARLGGQRGPQAKRYFDPARSNDLDDYVAAFPTPSTGGGGQTIPPDAEWVGMTTAYHDGKKLQVGLASAVQKWPTPTSRDHKDTGDSIANGTVPVNGLLGRAVGPTRERGALSPDWCEWLMGWPIGWTDATRPNDALGPVYDWGSEPDLPRVGLGIPNRAKRLTAIGNGVVTAQAVFAWNRLEERLGV